MGVNPEEFEDGVYHDSHANDFCRIVVLDDTLGLYEPDGSPDSPYYTYDDDGLEMEDAVDRVRTNLREVSPAVVEDPEEYISSVLNKVTVGASLSLQEQIDLKFARRNTDF